MVFLLFQDIDQLKSMLKYIYLCYIGIALSISNLDIASLIIAYFLNAATFNTWLKVARSKLSNFPGFLVTIEAALGALYIKANSPKASPET